MKRADVLSIVMEHRTALEQMGVRSLDLFGSVARDEANLESDVDFLVEINAPMGLFQFLKIKHYLEDILGRSVDLGTTDSIKQHLQEPVLRETIRVF